MALELLEEFLALDVFRIGFQRLVRILVAVLELPQLEGEQAIVKGRLEEVLRQSDGRAEVVLRLVYVSFPQLQNPKIVVGLGVGRVHRYRDLERLVGEPEVPDTDGHVPDVVPLEGG